MTKFLLVGVTVAFLTATGLVAQAKDLYAFPVQNATYSRFFGWQDSDKKIFNDGVDLLAPAGSYVRAWSAGKVQSVGYNPKCGWQITITYTTWVTTYCNIQKEYTYPIGAPVDAGTTVGVLSAPPGQKYTVLHWSLKADGELVNPFEVAEDIQKKNKQAEPTKKR